METLFLIASIAGQRVALPAYHVESVVEMESVTPVPLVVPHIAGLFALRSRVLTVIDSLAALGLGRTPIGGLMQAVIVGCDGHPYALLVESVEDVVRAPRPQPPCAVLSPEWARAARGMIEHEGEPLLLIDPAALVAGPPAIAA
ncbi:chemotaxis protein CheW [Sphingomonas oleivorans]|uniref:Chemotaxis protein CheW n=1 Tax=Sphingomonas oleivorans TaxID=1735121 RepID=A0A2T5FTH6_9SPHN|nr:chemotaxis protein CheW [Sphingomonas oleivorans]PTQ07366.1 chemotaxis protein CheW [Sphingomonas oleivorans]